ncbi:receptor-transporting protein 3-like [Eucyclogobius newberryi]|uniref:receptor-transporting protein 3-like n=1 Tax=Eucyclogobius newberryi TaxID=166745 RepID=UPI003B5C545C
MSDFEWTKIFENEIEKYTGDFWQLEFDDTIIPGAPNRGWKQYIRNTFGRFKCSKCKRGWPSNRVTVVFHFRLNKKHGGSVKVRLYRQKCKICRHAPMVKPTVDTENIDILMENLVKNIRWKCYHEDIEKNTRDHVGQDVESPHEPDHCEGCISGICKLKDAAEFYRSRR